VRLLQIFAQRAPPWCRLVLSSRGSFRELVGGGAGGGANTHALTETASGAGTGGSSPHAVHLHGEQHLQDMLLIYERLLKVRAHTHMHTRTHTHIYIFIYIYIYIYILALLTRTPTHPLIPKDPRLCG
jgi:hypothetical protein